VRPDFELLAGTSCHMGDRRTQYLLIPVGRGMGPATRAPVRLAVSTISLVD